MDKGIDTVGILAKQVESMAVGFIAQLPQLLIGVIVILLTWAVARGGVAIAKRVMANTDLRPSLRQLILTLVSIILWIIGIMIALTVIIPGLSPAGIFAGLGIGTVAIGFAFQDIFENFLAGILIMLRKTMKIGDLIECESIIGRVEHISLRETHVRKPSGELTVVPNSMLFKNPVEIFTEKPLRRHELVVGVGYDEDANEAQKVIYDAVRGIPELEQEKPVEVYALAFGASSIDYTVRWWAGSQPVDLHKSRDLVVLAIKRALDDAGIEIPYPYVTNTFKGAVDVLARPGGSNMEQGQ